MTMELDVDNSFNEGRQETHECSEFIFFILNVIMLGTNLINVLIIVLNLIFPLLVNIGKRCVFFSQVKMKKTLEKEKD